MSQHKIDYIHADLRKSHHGALRRRENSLLPAITYQGVIARLVAHPDADTFLKPQHLPELSHPELSAALKHYPEVLAEAIAENDIELRASVAESLSAEASPSHRYALVGIEFVEAMRRYVLPLILQDVRAQIEVNRECARMDLQRVMS